MFGAEPLLLEVIKPAWQNLGLQVEKKLGQNAHIFGGQGKPTVLIADDDDV